MRVVVTGGAGFIGSHIVERLIHLGHEVLVIDDLSSGFRSNLSEGVGFVEASIDASAATDAITSFQPESIVHAAAQISVRTSMENPGFDAEVNVVGFLKLLNTLKEALREKAQELPHLIFLSTGGAIYGDTELVPTEEGAPILPESLYGLHKRFGELYLDFWHRMIGLPYTVLRLGNVYGPRQNPHGEAGVVAIFAELLLKGQSCTIFGDGSQTRDFVYVGDVVDAVVAAMNRKKACVELEGCFNVGTGIETTVQELFEMMKQVSGSSSELVFAPARAGEQQRSAISPRRAERILGWKAAESLRSGLERTFEFYASRYASVASA
ncbi:MAG: NAD-dependent epimerase/dehydratase family protein [Bdellovibrionota bacterium]|jgi:UDP-glucose 4-epimerase